MTGHVGRLGGCGRQDGSVRKVGNKYNQHRRQPCCRPKSGQTLLLRRNDETFYEHKVITKIILVRENFIEWANNGHISMLHQDMSYTSIVPVVLKRVQYYYIV